MIQKRLVPTELAALAAGVSEATIRKWASRSKLTRYGSRGRAQYDLDELLDLVSSTRLVGADVRPAIDPALHPPSDQSPMVTDTTS